MGTALAKAGPMSWPTCTFKLTFPGSGSPEPCLEVPGLFDALLMALPIWADELPPRKCKGCGRMIAIPQERQKFCGENCGGAARQRRFKRKARARTRLARGESAQSIAKRYGFTLKEVRQLQGKRTQKRRGT